MTNPETKRYSAVLFDMDGVIVDSMPCHAGAWIEVFKEHGLVLTTEDIYKREGMSGLDSIKDIFVEKGYPVPAVEDLRRLQEKKHVLFERHRVEVFPFVRDMLETLTLENISVGLVTGSLRRSVRHVLPLHLEKFFSVIITVEDIVRGKPSPEPYLKALEALAVNGKAALAVENAPLGIRAAKRAGIDCFALETTLAASYLGEADEIFPDHQSLLHRFQSVYREDV